MLDIYVIGQLVVASISCTASLTVLLTLLLFRTMRDKPFMRIIAYISLCDLCGNAAYLSTARPENGSPLCVLESFLNLAFYPASWLWTTVLVYCLYLLAIEKRFPPNLHKYHLICWPIPIFFFLISIPFTEYKAPSRDGNEVCTLGGFIANIYHSATYYGILFFGSFFIMILLRNRILVLEKIQSSGANEPTFIIAKAALKLYPFALIVCWIPHITTVLLNFYHFKKNESIFSTVYYYCDLLKISHGTVTAIIFFYKSQEARKVWYYYYSYFVYYCCYCCCCGGKGGRGEQRILNKNLEFRTRSEDEMIITEKDILAKKAALSIQANSTTERSYDGMGLHQQNFQFDEEKAAPSHTASVDANRTVSIQTMSIDTIRAESRQTMSIDSHRKRQDSKGWFAFSY